MRFLYHPLLYILYRLNGMECTKIIVGFVFVDKSFFYALLEPAIGINLYSLIFFYPTVTASEELPVIFIFIVEMLMSSIFELLSNYWQPDERVVFRTLIAIIPAE